MLIHGRNPQEWIFTARFFKFTDRNEVRNPYIDNITYIIMCGD